MDIIVFKISFATELTGKFHQLRNPALCYSSTKEICSCTYTLTHICTHTLIHAHTLSYTITHALSEILSPMHTHTDSHKHLLTHIVSHSWIRKIFILLKCKHPFVVNGCSRSAKDYNYYRIIIILSQVNPVHTISSYFSKIHFNINLPPTSRLFYWSSGLFPSGFPTCILYAFLFSPMRSTFHIRLVLLGLIILIILGKDLKVMKLLIMQFSSASCSKIPPLCFLPLCHRTNFTHIQNYRQNYSFVYFIFYIFLGSRPGDKRF
jgi:hypothetical protein